MDFITKIAKFISVRLPREEPKRTPPLLIADAACCIWEHFLDKNRQEHADIPYASRSAFMQTWEDNGTCFMRDIAVSNAEACHLAYCKAVEEDGYDDSFDWEFVPAWCKKHLTW